MGGYTNFRTVSPGETAKPDTGTHRDIRSRQIDELIALSNEAKRDTYGPTADVDDKNFYNLFERERKMPTFRPRIQAPQLQVLFLNEVAEMSDSDVRVFIHKGDDRDEQREEAFQMHWKQNFFAIQLIMAQIYAKFSGTSFLGVGIDPYANRGKGNVWLRARQQQKVHCDPNSWWPPDWTWQIIEDQMQLDEIKKVYGKAAFTIAPRGQKTTNLAGPPAGPLEMPPGPMSTTVKGLPTDNNGQSGGPFTVRQCYVKDYSMRDLTDEEKLILDQKNLPYKNVVVPEYPDGRMIVDCEGTVLSDGEAWLPLGDMWPNIPVWAIPPWDSVWAPPPKKYTKSLQDAAEQQMTQVYENARRLNNGIMEIHESSGLKANSVGGLPGEVVMVAANCPPGQGIKINYPPAFPPQMIQYPKFLLDLQKELRGATAARSGNVSPGNTGADLFEAAVGQSQTSEKLTAKFFSWSVQKACELLFYTMCKSFTDKTIFHYEGEAKAWEPDTNFDKYTIQAPDIRPMSQTALRNMVIELKKVGLIDVRRALKWLDVPDYDKIAEGIEQEQKLAALAKLNRK